MPLRFRWPWRQKTSPKPPESPLSSLASLRQLTLRTRLLSAQRLQGGYRSSFRGNGMQFREVREYQPGDDIRFIEWNASARSGGMHTYTKVFQEEREMTVYFMIDHSWSMHAHTQPAVARQVLEVLAMLGSSIVASGDKLGMMVFARELLHHSPARKGQAHLYSLLKTLHGLPRPAQAGTSLQGALAKVLGMVPHKSVIVMLSDFADDGYAQALKQVSARHDCIGIQILQPLPSLPRWGFLPVADAETQHTHFVWLGSRKGRQALMQQEQRLQTEAAQLFKAAHADFLLLHPGDDAAKTLESFFHRRSLGAHA